MGGADRGATSRSTAAVALTAAAFRQEPLEREAAPDVYVVVSVHRDGALIPIHRASFPGLDFAAGRADLGTIVLPHRDAWQALDGVSCAPGWDKSARRLELKDAIVGHAVAEIVPLVERLTGWSHLLERTAVRIAPTPSDAWGPVMKAVGAPALGRIEKPAFDVLLGISGFAGLYDPFSKTVCLLEPVLASQNLDGMKVMLGHELVHAGQFLHHPELVERYVEHVRSLYRANASDEASSNGGASDDASDVLDPKLGPEAARAYAAGRSFMTNIEGYASYIEVDFLRRTYALATPLPHLSLLGRGLVQLLRPSGAPAAKGAMTDKMNEYQVGREAYQRLQRGEVPARFDPALDPIA